jgi:hypothetical protein
MMRRGFFCLLTLTFLAAADALHAADLPPNLQAIKQQVIDITSANTTRTDNIAEVRTQLEPLLAQLEAWYIANRPANEVALTQVPWKNLWYDDPDIAFAIDLGFFALEQPRDRIFQVVENGYYYNVSELVFRLFGLKITTQNYLKGAYTIVDPATAETLGQPMRNVIALTFVSNGLQLGPIPRWLPLSPLVRLVDAGRFPVLPIFGPTGVQGRLWNRYVDADLRISAGYNLNQPEVIDLYILRKVTTAQ